MLNASEVSVCTGTCPVLSVTISVFVSTDNENLNVVRSLASVPFEPLTPVTHDSACRPTLQHHRHVFLIKSEHETLKIRHVTGDSVSNPERAPCRQILLVVNDLIRKNESGVTVVMALSDWSVGKTFVNCPVGRSCAADCV